jgi:hypothetical protein
MELWDNLEQNMTDLIISHLAYERGRLIGKNFIQMLNEFNGLELESSGEVLMIQQRLGRTRRS